MTDSDKGSFRQTFASVYLPTTIYETGIGAITPVIPLTAIALGASPARAAFTVALLGIGQVAGDIPAGHLAARLGDRKAMLYGSMVTIVVLVLAELARAWWMLAVATFLIGGVNSLFVLARQAYLTEATAPERRSRALSTLGGMQRVGALIGPFLGGLAMSIAGSRLAPPLGVAGAPLAPRVGMLAGDWLPAAYLLAIALTIATAIVVWRVPDVPTPGRVVQVETAARRIVAINWRLFATLGIAFLLIGGLRQTRAVVLPLWSEQIGLSASAASYIFGISGLLDVALFYPGGRLMDKRGRLWVVVPSMMILGVALLLLPLATTFQALAVVALVMGLGNGLGSGMLMTIGADLAPPKVRSQFLSVCRMLSDTGTGLGPLIIAQAALLTGSLATGIYVMGAGGLIAVAIMVTRLPIYTVHANRHSRRRAGLTSEGLPMVEESELAPVGADVEALAAASVGGEARARAEAAG